MSFEQSKLYERTSTYYFVDFRVGLIYNALWAPVLPTCVFLKEPLQTLQFSFIPWIVVGGVTDWFFAICAAAWLAKLSGTILICNENIITEGLSGTLYRQSSCEQALTYCVQTPKQLTSSVPFAYKTPWSLEIYIFFFLFHWNGQQFHFVWENARSELYIGVHRNNDVYDDCNMWGRWDEFSISFQPFNLF